MLEKLTEEQEKLMYQTAEEWIDLFNNTKRIDEKAFEEGIKWLYGEQLKKKHPKIVYCESWLEALVTIDTLQNNVGANVGDNVRDNVWANVRANVGANVGDNVWANVRDNVWANVRANVGTNVRDNVWDNVWANVGDNVRANSSNELNTGPNFGWASFYDYFEKIGVLENHNFKKYKKLVRAGAFQVFEFENYVFAVQPAENMFRNELGQLNSIESKAFEWSDGYGFYFVNGMSLPEKIFNKLLKKELTSKEFFELDNEETKSAVIGFIQQKYGEAYLFDFLRENLQEIDTYVDKKENVYLEGTIESTNIGVYTLFKGNINNSEVAYVRCYCPSTDRMFFLGVEPNNTNAKDAIASLYQVPEILKDNIETICRQGEKFSTTFDDKTTEKLKNNQFSLEELNKYVSLPGEKYFQLMKFEY